MTKLMEKKDWLNALADVGAAESVWCDTVAGDPFDVSVSLPEAGRYRVILVKLDDLPKPQPAVRNRRDMEISPQVHALRGAAKFESPLELFRSCPVDLSELINDREEDLPSAFEKAGGFNAKEYA